MITSKSPVAIMKAAFELGRQLFADHAHKFGPQTFTEPQLFACLALREHQKKSYRGVEAALSVVEGWSTARTCGRPSACPARRTTTRSAGRSSGW
jgi:hypothetical protein